MLASAGSRAHPGRDSLLGVGTGDQPGGQAGLGRETHSPSQGGSRIALDIRLGACPMIILDMVHGTSYGSSRNCKADGAQNRVSGLKQYGASERPHPEEHALTLVAGQARTRSKCKLHQAFACLSHCFNAASCVLALGTPVYELPNLSLQPRHRRSNQNRQKGIKHKGALPWTRNQGTASQPASCCHTINLCRLLFSFLTLALD